MNITANQLLRLIKSSVEFEGEDIHISVEKLKRLNNINHDDVITTLLEMKKVKISNNGITIPKEYFI